MIQADSTILEPEQQASSCQGPTVKWPPPVELIISALATARHGGINRRQRRREFRALAHLRLFSDQAGAAPWLLYTRDCSARGLGFITSHRLPLGHGGQVELPDPAGLTLHIDCVLSRCREMAPGWYEGALHFNREQPRFAT